jgi:predicted secreted protein
LRKTCNSRHGGSSWLSTEIVIAEPLPAADGVLQEGRPGRKETAAGARFDELAELPNQVTLRPGEETTLRLPSSAAGCYRWETAVDDGTVVDANAAFGEPVRAPSGHAAFNPYEVLTLRALKVGTTRVHCVQRRSWENDAPPRAEHTLTVAVTEEDKPMKGE